MTDEELEDAIRNIQHTLVLRWWIFAIMALVMGFAAWTGVANLQSIAKVKDIIQTADARSISNEAAIDASIKLQLSYQQQIAQSIDFLAKKNPNMIVPRAIIRPPKPTITPDEILKVVPPVPLTDADLMRPRTTTPTPTPTPKPTSTSLSRKKRKPSSPTPGPFYRLFQPRRTR